MKMTHSKIIQIATKLLMLELPFGLLSTVLKTWQYTVAYNVVSISVDDSHITKMLLDGKWTNNSETNYKLNS